MFRALLVRRPDGRAGRRGGGRRPAVTAGPPDRPGRPGSRPDPVAEVLGQIWSESGVVARVLGRSTVTVTSPTSTTSRSCCIDGAPQGRSGVAGLLALLDSPAGRRGRRRCRQRRDRPADRVRGGRRPDHDGLAGQGPGVPGRLPADDVAASRANRTSLVYTDPATGDRMLDVTGNGEWPTRAGPRSARKLATTEEAAEQPAHPLRRPHPGPPPHAVWWAAPTSRKSTRPEPPPVRPGRVRCHRARPTRIRRGRATVRR